jgi:threonine/homoserine/homoserine lactone efflux protein
MTNEPEQARRGRVIALVIASVSLSWIGLLALGDTLGWTQRTLAFFDLAALGGFAYALWLLFGLWRSGQQNKD